MVSDSDRACWQQASEIFDQLLELPADKRSTELNRLAPDPAVRKKVEAMLEAEASPGLLDKWPVNEFLASADEGEDPRLGQVHGAYRLESLIARGGMSAVYRAVRVDGAYASAVAFKLLSTALMSSDWPARFRRETDLLARLRHPGIATLLDAGVTEDGTPYLVTELVEGEPVHHWCDRHGTGIRVRVELVVQLCQAVAHAQKQLIVHRDIKSDNVLVTEGGQVKLLDFGIARQLPDNPDEDNPTTLTRVFTPGYAAPEQLAGEPVSTATDVFAIGVLMYRLLTGQLPFAVLTSSGQRQPVAQPSRKVKTSESMDRFERQRRHRLLKGDLDNIVTCALAEDPAGRYSNAQKLGEDLQNWLDHRPVTARRTSMVRRMALFARRRTALAASLAGLFLVTVIGIYAVIWQAREARLQAADALAASERARAVSEFMVGLFEAADPDLHGNQPPDARALLDIGREQADSAFAGQPDTRRELLLVLARLQRKLGELDGAAQSIADSDALNSDLSMDRIRARIVLAGIHFDRGESSQAVALTQAAIDDLTGNIDEFTRTDLMLLHANALNNSGESEQAINVADQLLEQLGAAGNPDLRLIALAEKGGFLIRLDQQEAALEILAQAAALAEQGHGSPTARYTILSNQSHAYTDMGQLIESIKYQRQALELMMKTYPHGHRRHAQIAGNLATRLQLSGHWHEAEQYFEQALSDYGRIYPEPNLHSAAVHNNFGLFMLLNERYHDALPHLKIAARVAQDAFGETDPRYLSAWTNLAYAWSMIGDERGGRELRAAAQARSQALGSDSIHVAISHGLLADHWLRAGEIDLALQASAESMRILAHHDDQPNARLLMPMIHRARALQSAGHLEESSQLYALLLQKLDALGNDSGYFGLRAIDYYTEFLTEHQPDQARLIVNEWLHSELAASAAESPAVNRLRQRQAWLADH